MKNDLIWTTEIHRQVHIKLHEQFDMLLADYFRHNAHDTRGLQTTVRDLMTWSSAQTRHPTDNPPIFIPDQPKRIRTAAIKPRLIKAKRIVIYPTSWKPWK